MRVEDAAGSRVTPGAVLALEPEGLRAVHILLAEMEPRRPLSVAGSARADLKHVRIHDLSHSCAS